MSKLCHNNGRGDIMPKIKPITDLRDTTALSKEINESDEPIFFFFYGNIDFIIEYQGKQHYEASSKFGGKRGLYQQQHNDNKKRRFCALHGLKLIEIPYTEENLITYDYIMREVIK